MVTGKLSLNYKVYYYYILAKNSKNWDVEKKYILAEEPPGQPCWDSMGKHESCD